MCCILALSCRSYESYSTRRVETPWRLSGADEGAVEAIARAVRTKQQGISGYQCFQITWRSSSRWSQLNLIKSVWVIVDLDLQKRPIQLIHGKRANTYTYSIELSEFQRLWCRPGGLLMVPTAFGLVGISKSKGTGSIRDAIKINCDDFVTVSQFRRLRGRWFSEEVAPEPLPLP